MKKRVRRKESVRFFIEIALFVALVAVVLAINSNAKAEEMRIEYHISYLTASDPKKALIVFYNEDTGKTVKILADKNELDNPKAMDAIWDKVEEENARN